MLARLWRGMLEAACRSVSLQRGQMLSGRQPPALSKAFVVVKRVTVRCGSNTKVVQHQPSKPEQGRHADLDRMLICRRSARKADVCTVARRTLQPCLLCTERNFISTEKRLIFKERWSKFSSRGSAPHPAGAPPRTPVWTHTPVAVTPSWPPRALGQLS